MCMQYRPSRISRRRRSRRTRRRGGRSYRPILGRSRSGRSQHSLRLSHGGARLVGGRLHQYWRTLRPGGRRPSRRHACSSRQGMPAGISLPVARESRYRQRWYTGVAFAGVVRSGAILLHRQ